MNTDNGKVQQIKPMEEYPIPIKKTQNWDFIANAMRNVIMSKEGTGFRFGRNTPYTVAAKTGTAQVYSGKLYENAKYQDIPENLRDNSLFIAFAPVQNSKVAIAVVVENDFVASNVARKVLDSYFNIFNQKTKS